MTDRVRWASSHASAVAPGETRCLFESVMQREMVLRSAAEHEVIRAAVASAAIAESVREDQKTAKARRREIEAAGTCKADRVLDRWPAWMCVAAAFAATVLVVALLVLSVLVR